jgi:hypothetical protein
MDGERTVLCSDWLPIIKHRLRGSTGDGDFIAGTGDHYFEVYCNERPYSKRRAAVTDNSLEEKI